MKKKTEEHGKAGISERRCQPLRLAVAAAALGMSIGISPSDVLAAPKQPVLETQTPASVERSGAKYPKVERPGAEFPKVEQPDAQFLKLERPSAQFPKVEQPGAQFPKTER